MILKAKRAVGTSRGGRSGGLQIKMDRQRHPRLKVMSSRSVGDWYTERHDEDSSEHLFLHGCFLLMWGGMACDEVL